MRATTLYLLGVGITAFGFYQFWRDRTLDPQLFIIGGGCIAAAAAVQVIADLWRRMRR